jgi:hypothetical protein
MEEQAAVGFDLLVCGRIVLFDISRGLVAKRARVDSRGC